jgi:multidrug efflux pump
LAFTPGRTGKLFSEFALALAGAVLVSGLVALTLSPMMSSLLLRHNPNPNRFDRFMEKLLTGISTGYENLLVKVLRHFRWLVIAIMLACGVGIAVVYPTMKQELSPLEDRGVVLVTVNAPDGSTLDYTNKYALILEKIGSTYPEFDRIFANLGNPTVAQPH